MSDAQLTAIISAIVGLGGLLAGALRWAVRRVTKSSDDGTAALVANTASNAVLVTKMDELIRRIDRMSDRFETHSGVTAVPEEIRPWPARARTNPLGTPALPGYRLPRPGTHHDPDDDA